MRGFSNEIGTIANHFGGQFANLVGFNLEVPRVTGRNSQV
jgi:hypothetical protein